MQHIYKFPTDDTDTWTPPPMSKGHRGRYLWTDAFAVLNFITLARETANPIYLSHARTLVSTVHGILGRTRDGSTQLPGAAPSSPLEGGLRKSARKTRRGAMAMASIITTSPSGFLR